MLVLKGCGVGLLMKAMAYCLYRENEFFVSQCLNVDVSSFGATREDAISNLKEAVELYFEGRNDANGVSHTSLGQAKASPQDT